MPRPIARLILLNGPPGIGKSTLAARYVAGHPGTLDCDIDVLRTMIGGWESDFAGAGGRIRTAALALMTAYLRGGEDVMLPQLVARVEEVERFEAAAAQAGADFVELMLTDDVEDAVARFHRRGEAADASHRVKHDVVASAGGDEALRRTHAALREVAAARPRTRVVPTLAGDVDGAYTAVLAALAGG